MNQSYHQIRRGLMLRALKIFDLLSIGTIFSLSALFHFRLKEDVSFIDFLEMRISIFNALLLIVLMSGFYTFFEVFHLYRSRRLEKWYTETFDMVRMFAVCTVLLIIWRALFSIGIFDRYFLTLFFTGSVVWFSLSRIALRGLLTFFRNRGRNLRHVVVVGTNPRAVSIGRRFQREPALGFHLLGFVDNTIMAGACLEKEAALLCDFNRFDEYLRSHVVDEVVLCLPLNSLYREASQVASLCKAQGIVVRQMADLYGMNNRDAGMELLDVYDTRRHLFAMVVKRVFDIGISLSLLVLLSPFLLAIALLIKIDSPGPALFIQERIGINKRKFWLFKFRTMRHGAEKMIDGLAGNNEMDGPVFKMKYDPRVTSIGRRLRKYSIDELPQLFNVLRGDMSLVGPRPLPVRDFQGFNEDWHRRRCSVRPGITCLWQVAGRNSVTFDRWMQLDMEYIDNWSLRVDLAILLRTVPAVFSGKGAA